MHLLESRLRDDHGLPPGRDLREARPVESEENEVNHLRTKLKISHSGKLAAEILGLLLFKLVFEVFEQIDDLSLRLHNLD